MQTLAPLDHDICDRARLSRDARFDGLFFTAVRSTGIYCRPVCPAPQPKPQNVQYFRHAAAARAAGFRPCLRCRPELSPAQTVGEDDVFAQAMSRIDAGALGEASVAHLARELGLSDRHLRRLFIARLGVTPLAVHANRRLLFAKQLLSETALPVTEVAWASGFRSLRRFNTAFRDECGMAPTALRRQSERPADAGVLQLRLAYRPPYDFSRLLKFLAARALPGIERVGEDSYERVIGSVAAPGWLRVSAIPGESALRLEVCTADVRELTAVVRRVRRLFDLDADPLAISAVLSGDALLAPLLQQRPGLRVPGAYAGYEAAVRAVLGQQVSVAAATTLASRLVQRFGIELPSHPNGFERLFPTPAQLAAAELVQIGVTKARAATLRHLSIAIERGELDCEQRSDLDRWQERATRLPGIGSWTAQYLALRALHHPDAYPAGDLVIRKALGAGATLSESQALARAVNWRPWRAYAVLHLWAHWNETQ